MKDRKEKIKRSEWQQATPARKRELYLKYHQFHTAAQAAIWNNIKQAFHVFEKMHVE